MKLGIKVGPQKTSLSDLEDTRASFCEVWFDINRLPEYDNLFEYIRRHGIDTGLHYWAALPDGTWTNLAYPDGKLIAATATLIRKTIDIAAIHRFSYVNIHPGCAAKIGIDFARQEFRLLSDPVDPDIAESVFLEQARKLHGYAVNRGIVLTFETVPLRVTQNFQEGGPRIHPLNIFELPLSTLIHAAQLKLWIANDLVHTAANLITDDPGAVWNFLYQMSKRLLPQTRLLHIGFLVAPYNGTDFHDSLNNPMFDTP